MSQPYEFFPGVPAQAVGFEAPAPAAPAGQFGHPAPSEATYAASGPAPAAAPARPGIVSVLTGVLVAQAALAAAPAIALLLVRDVIGKIMDAVSSGLAGGSGPGSVTVSSSSSGTGTLTLWGVAFLLVTVASALSAFGVLDGRSWSVVTAGLTAVVVLAWAVLHFGDWPTVSAVALVVAVTTGALLATPDVRRWCLAA